MVRDWLPEDRATRIGLGVSVGAHLGLFLWAVMGGIFFPPEPKPPVVMAEVSLMTSDQFAKIAGRAPTAPTESPPQPSAPKASQKPPAKPVAKPEPKPQPAPPVPAPEPDAAPDQPPTPPAPDQKIDLPPTDKPTEKPKASTQVTDTPTETPPPDATTAETTTPQTSDQPAPTPTPPKPTEAQAPADAGQVLQTEATKDQTTIGGAPAASVVPPPRPKKAPAPPAPAAPADTQTASADTPPTPDATEGVDAALADALSGAQSDTPQTGTGIAANGPPLTSGEKDGFRIAVKECWTTGALSTDAANTIVTVGMTMSPDGMPGNLRLLGSQGGSGDSAQQAYEAARRAILRCAKSGYPLPRDKYDSWKEVELTFDGTKYQLR